MGKIAVLNQAVAELIAAGEVVERPSSIVKELVENSIDAGASAVTVEIRRGGISYLRVTDNGSGMEKEDIPTAFLRHATSKIASREDLESIHTFGFRGEALASVAAVSRVEILTKTRESFCGWRYSIAGGAPGELCEAGCPDGTTLVVRDLFYNTPARMKFLKRDVTEANSVAAVMDKMALSHPEVSFRFLRDGELKLHSPGSGDLRAAIHAVYGSGVVSGLIPVEYQTQAVTVSGYISKPQYARGTRGMENFFVNTRYIRSKTCMAALEEAFHTYLITGKFPVCVLNVQLNPMLVDVNVHPAKIEVRFSNEKSVFDAVFHGCRQALEQSDLTVAAQMETGAPSSARINLANLEYDRAVKPQQTIWQQAEKPAFSQVSAERFRQEFAPKAPAAAPSAPRPAAAPRGTAAPVSAGDRGEMLSSSRLPFSISYPAPAKQPASRPAEQTPLQPQPPQAPERPEPTEKESPLDYAAKGRYIGQLFGTYILVEYEQQLYLVDKHAAHEKIRYKQIRAEVDAGICQRQTLLAPLSVTLDKAAYSAAVEHAGLFEQLGFVVEDFGSGGLLVREIPAVARLEDCPAMVEEIAAKLAENSQELKPSLLDDICHSVACHSAVRGNSEAPDEDLKEILRLMAEDGDIRHCPHGRPVAISISRYQIEKMFGRLG